MCINTVSVQLTRHAEPTDITPLYKELKISCMHIDVVQIFGLLSLMRLQVTGHKPDLLLWNVWMKCLMNWLLPSASNAPVTVLHRRWWGLGGWEQCFFLPKSALFHFPNSFLLHTEPCRWSFIFRCAVLFLQSSGFLWGHTVNSIIDCFSYNTHKNREFRRS